MTIGIYTIINTVDGKQYVGKSKNIERRLAQHWRDLSKPIRGRCVNRHLYNAFAKYGRIAFVTKTLETFDCVDETTIANRELYWIDFLNTCCRNHGYNLRRDSDSKMIVHPETRLIMSKARKGCKGNPLFGEDNPNYGNRWNDQQKIAASNTAKNVWLNTPDDVKHDLAKKVSDATSKYIFHQIDLRSNEIIQSWNSMYDVCHDNPSYRRAAIYNVCNGYNKTYRGYKWEKELKNEDEVGL